MERTILAAVDDLLFRSKIYATAAAAGSQVHFGREASAAPDLILLDLQLADALSLLAAWRQQWPAVRVIGYLSHVEQELARQAREAGCTEILPRSAFVQRLPQLLAA